jgi:hypothetical protein
MALALLLIEQMLKRVTNLTFLTLTFRRIEMIVKDLEIAQELSHEESAAVRGGNTTQIGVNLGGSQSVAGGFLFGSPVAQVSGPQLNANNSTTTDVNVATIANSAFTTIGQLA